MANTEVKVEETNNANQPSGGAASAVTSGNPGEVSNPNVQNQLAALLHQQQQQQQQQQNAFASQLNPGFQGFVNPQMALLQQQLMAQQARQQLALSGGLGNLGGLMNLGGVNPQILNLLAQQQMMQAGMVPGAGQMGAAAPQNQGNLGNVPSMIDTSAGKKQDQDSAASSVSNHKPKKKKAAKASKAAKHVIEEEPLDRPKRPLSAYNLFFKDQRLKLLGLDKEVVEGEEPRKNKIGFAEMAKTISARWKELDEESAAKYKALAAEEKKAYQDKMKLFSSKRKKLQKKIKSNKAKKEAGSD